MLRRIDSMVRVRHRAIVIAGAVSLALFVADCAIAAIRDNASFTTTGPNGGVAANQYITAPARVGGSGDGCTGPVSAWETHTATATVTITSRATDWKRIVFNPSFTVRTDAGAQHLCDVDSPNPSDLTRSSWGWIGKSSCVVPILVSDGDQYAETRCNASFYSYYPVTDAVTPDLLFDPGRFTASGTVSGLNNADVARLQVSYH